MAMLRAARRILPPATQLAVQRATLERLPYKNESFDIVMAAHVIEHLADPALAMDEMVRVLKPDAPLLIVSTKRGCLGKLLQLKWRIHCWQEATLERLLRSRGIADIRFLPVAGPYWCRKLSLACIGRKRRETP